MKNDFQTCEVMTDIKLYSAYKSCVRRKVNTPTHAAYFSHLEENLFVLK